MARGTPSAVTTPFRDEVPEPITLVHIQLDGTAADQYLCTGEVDVEMGGLTWTARPLEHGDGQLESHNETGGVDLHIADTDEWWKTQIDSGAVFTGNRVTMYRTDRSALGSAQPLTDAIRDDFIIETWERAQGAIRIPLAPLLSLLDLEVPLATVTRREFPGIPGVNQVP